MPVRDGQEARRVREAHGTAQPQLASLCHWSLETSSACFARSDSFQRFSDAVILDTFPGACAALDGADPNRSGERLTGQGMSVGPMAAKKVGIADQRGAPGRFESLG